ncbi:hypothetical protein TSUD_132430 [Trifolium subterraneum]|uniref:Uncharacterized protein n=1 Tax=Trifolium subterraneum TaxID=3900 RepID=A0A2Z6LTZ5_TRISU|nr:hypothetical protein TSUD_132430 [Trifolium subterraneum]
MIVFVAAGGELPPGLGVGIEPPIDGGWVLLPQGGAVNQQSALNQQPNVNQNQQPNVNNPEDALVERISARLLNLIVEVVVP